MTIRFDSALRLACDLVRSKPQELEGAGRTVLVRDLLGRIRAAVEIATPGLARFDERLGQLLGNYHGGPTLVAAEMIAPEAIFGSTDFRRIEGVDVLERVLMGADWTRPPLANSDPKPPRATLYGMKGGVGRSTALVAWARHLASRGERVLVVDLDLESPGVSSSMLPRGGGVEFGVVDWLVEDAASGADAELVRMMVAPSPLANGTSGDIMVVPCGSEADTHYLAKLSRAYLDVPSIDGTRMFANRLASMVDSLERTHEPTVVLLDSRAGLHDLAAIATTRLGAMTFLFGIGTRQTWDGYRTLLSSWASSPAIARDIRERLRVVAAQVPEVGRDDYLRTFALAAYDAFEPLYDRTPESGSDAPDAFNFDIGAPDAPHFPLPIYWSREFQDWDPLGKAVTLDQVRASFGTFLDAATSLLDEYGNDDE